MKNNNIKNFPMCPFCLEQLNNYENPLKKPRIVLETKNLYAVPGIGAFIPNYIIIISKKHYNCVGEFSNEEYNELDQMLSILGEINTKIYNSKTVVFEHGALFPRNDSGKSITHAHMHVFPCNFSLLDDAIVNNYKYLEKNNVRELKEIAKSYDKYLYLHDVDGKDYAIIHDGIESQYFRQILAKKLGMESGWNWRETPRIEETLKILDDYKENPMYISVLNKFKGELEWI